MTAIMNCGCAANCLIGDVPGCGIHDSVTPVEDTPNLIGRESRCTYCGQTEPSTNWQNLAFFSYRSNVEYDDHYCGCRGWD